MSDQPHISVVIPVHNEEGSVDELTRLLETVLPGPYELIFVDDGSTDRTWERLTPLHRAQCVRLVRLRKRFGKTAALTAGLSLCRGRIVFTMDGDLQDDPRDIPRFLAKIEQGFDLVTGWKKTRYDPLHKVLSSWLFNLAVRWTSGLQLHDVNCGFKAFRGEVARGLRIHGELHRFIPVLVAAQGFRVGEIEVTHHARRHGRSKYGFARMFKGVFDLVTVVLLTRFADRPAHAFGFAAIAFLIAGIVLAGLRQVFPWRGASALLPPLFWLSAVVLLAAGWVAEIFIARGGNSEGIPPYSIQEQLD